MNSKKRVVLETNIIVSALWSDFGNPYIIIKLMPGSIIPCLNNTILMEYKDVLERPKFDFSTHKKEALFFKIKEFGEIVSPDEGNISLPDESDRIFYDTARASGAILITENIKRYPTEPFIMTPAEFIQKLEPPYRRFY